MNLPMPEKLKAVKERLKSWNKSEFGLIDDNIRKLEDKIQNIDSVANSRSLEDHELQERNVAQVNLWTWLKRKESYWAQNSRSKWLK